MERDGVEGERKGKGIMMKYYAQHNGAKL